jgi:Flp pilus assembly protein TadB
MNALAALLGLVVGAGVMLLWSGLRPYGRVDAMPAALPFAGLLAGVRTRLWRALPLAGAVLLLTRWPVAAIGAGALGWFSSDLLGGKATRDRGVARTEAIATWAEMLRDTISAAHGLEAAIAATAPIAPDAIRSEIMSLAFDLERMPLPAALRRLADDLAHPIADLVVAALIVAANGSVRELAELLGTLATSARDEASMQLRVEAARARMRTAVQVITVCTLAMALGLVVLNPTYVESYGSVVGQMVLALIAGCWGVALVWLSSMSRFQTPARFLLAADREVRS